MSGGPMHRTGGAGVSAETATIIGWVLVLADLAIRIAALIIIPRDRKPTAAMAWLLAIFLIPFVGILLFLLIGSPKLPKARRERQLEINRMIADRSDRLDLARRPCRVAGVVRLGRRAEPEARRAARDRRQLGAAHRRLPRVDRRDGRGHRHGDALRARRVLHRRPRRHHEGVLRRDGARGAARRRGAPAARLRGLQARLRARGDHRRARPHRREVELHARRAADEGQVPAPRPAQPPQARRRRRPGRVHRVAEPHRPQLRLGEEPEARPAVAGAGDPGDRTDGDRDQRGVPVGLVQRDRRAARRRGERARRRGARRPLARRAGLPGRAERARRTRARTTCGCSSRSCRPPRRRSSSRARTSCPTRP